MAEEGQFLAQIFQAFSLNFIFIPEGTKPLQVQKIFIDLNT